MGGPQGLPHMGRVVFPLSHCPAHLNSFRTSLEKHTLCSYIGLLNCFYRGVNFLTETPSVVAKLLMIKKLKCLIYIFIGERCFLEIVLTVRAFWCSSEAYLCWGRQYIHLLWGSETFSFPLPPPLSLSHLRILLLLMLKYWCDRATGFVLWWSVNAKKLKP